MSEKIDLCDKFRKNIYKTIDRKDNVSVGEYKQAIHICIFNKEGKMLIQRRSKNKSSWPNMWDVTVGGGVKSGETSLMSAERELNEELGLTLEKIKNGPDITFRLNDCFDDIYLITCDVDLSKIDFYDNEVEEVRYASKEEILFMIDEGLFVQYYKCIIELFFEYKDKKDEWR